MLGSGIAGKVNVLEKTEFKDKRCLSVQWESTLNVDGPLMVRRWSAGGPLMVRPWSADGPVLVR